MALFIELTIYNSTLTTHVNMEQIEFFRLRDDRDGSNVVPADSRSTPWIVSETPEEIYTKMRKAIEHRRFLQNG